MIEGVGEAEPDVDFLPVLLDKCVTWQNRVFDIIHSFSGKLLGTYAMLSSCNFLFLVWVPVFFPVGVQFQFSWSICNLFLEQTLHSCIDRAISL